MDNFNKLTNAQAERLALLIEELGEAQQAVGKILRHGYESRNPIKPGPTNRSSLERELGDVLHAIRRMCAAGDIEQERVNIMADLKAENVAPYLHHQEDTTNA